MPKTRDFLTIEQALNHALKDLTDDDLTTTKKKKGGIHPYFSVSYNI